ncbi:hypothetical protein BC941DRAFT_419012 [Chlamydoabsidia padenii]|nr:hypothetical protein BC941DRAFT_419012 [Chlamydoabsidia padenii]
MLREKSGNTSLTTWLSKSKQQKQSTTRKATVTTLASEHGLENNKEKEEADIQRAIEQSRKDYMSQQKQQYDKLSSLYSTIESTCSIPSVDDDDAWFQSPLPSSPRSIRRSKLSLSTRKKSTSPLDSSAQDNDTLQPSSTDNLRSIKTSSSQDTGDDDLWELQATQVPKKEKEEEEEDAWVIEEEDTWAIKEDTSWVIESNSQQQLTEDDGIRATTINHTQPDDEMEDYLSAIRNRSTHNIPSSSRTKQQTSIIQQQDQSRRRPASLLDDAFNVISKDHTRQKKKSRCVNSETDPAYNPPKIYQTSLQVNSDRQDTSIHNNNVDDSDSDCESIIDLCVQDGDNDNESLQFVDDFEDQHTVERLSFDDDDSRHDIYAPTHVQQEQDEEDSGYLSPLEGFTSLLDQPGSNSNYQPYFDQLSASTIAPSRRRTTTKKPATKKPVFGFKRRFIRRK